MKIPSIFKYAKALGLMVVLSIALSFVFNFENIVNHDTTTFYTWIGRTFVALLVFNLIIGFALKGAGLVPKGSLKNDSLVISDTSYAGTVAPYFVLPALFSFDSANKNVIYIKDGIKKKHTIPTMDFSGPLQPRVATPSNSGGNLTISARTLTPNDVMAYQEMNPRNFEVHWDAEDLSQTLLARQLPQTVENYIILLLLGRSFEQFEVMLWQGSTQYQNNGNVPQFDLNGNPNPYYQIQFMDGFIKRMIADSSTFQVANPVVLTSANIGTALNAIYSSISINNKALLSYSTKYARLKFLVSIETARIYEEYLTTQPYKNNDTTEAGLNRWKGFDIVALAGMPDNTIVCTESMNTPESNLWFGLNSVSDENFMLARLFPNSELFFFKMLMKLDCNYGRSEKVFIYTTLTSLDFIQ